jgi:SAM-dependent methyltransferase
MTTRDDSARFEPILSDVARYYSSRLAENGTTARGVDWNGNDSQVLRFVQLSRILPESGVFSVHDVGCGYGAFVDFLEDRFPDFTYHGSDVSSEMVAAARERFKGRANAVFSDGAAGWPAADYCVASGIFNVCLAHSHDAWKDYVVATLDAIAEKSEAGFAFNCLTSYSDPERMRDHLYYANPGEIFDLCKRRYSRQVALLHDYGLYEFTILVRKEA